MSCICEKCNNQEFCLNYHQLSMEDLSAMTYCSNFARYNPFKIGSPAYKVMTGQKTVYKCRVVSITERIDGVDLKLDWGKCYPRLNTINLDCLNETLFTSLKEANDYINNQNYSSS